jgi:transmembrane sensor
MLANNRAWYLMARTLSNEASTEERRELQSLLQEDRHLQQQFSILKDFWIPTQEQDLQSTLKSERLLAKAKMQEQRHHSPKTKMLRYFQLSRPVWTIAASILTIVVAGFFLLQPNSPTQYAEQVVAVDSIITPNGNRSQLLLPDGSRVWLNSGSTLRYHSFSGKTREVELIGEAYFDVVKMPEKPFIVHAEGVNIKVLGTSFNVRCYPEDKNIEATLLHGAISVTHKNDPGKKTILLKPNQKLSISKIFTLTNNSTIDIPYSVDDLDSTVQPTQLVETAWVYNRLEFKNTDFRTLAAKMERWYNVKIVFADENVQQLRFVGSFEKETVEEALSALKLVADFSYETKNNEINIHSSK